VVPSKVTEHPFYRALDKLLREDGFDEFAEEVCAEFYAGNVGRPGIPPGVYFRALMVGYLEGISSERGIAWRCQGLVFAARVPGVRADEEPAGPFEPVEDAQAAERGGARRGVRALARRGYSRDGKGGSVVNTCDAQPGLAGGTAQARLARAPNWLP